MVDNRYGTPRRDDELHARIRAAAVNGERPKSIAKWSKLKARSISEYLAKHGLGVRGKYRPREKTLQPPDSIGVFFDAQCPDICRPYRIEERDTGRHINGKWYATPGEAFSDLQKRGQTKG